MVKTLRDLALAGNILFILWMTWNGIDERGQGATLYQIASYVGLTVLLILNSYLIFRKN